MVGTWRWKLKQKQRRGAVECLLNSPCSAPLLKGGTTRNGMAPPTSNITQDDDAPQASLQAEHREEFSQLKMTAR